MKFIAYNEDEGRNEFVSHVEGESRKYSALQSLLSGRKLEQEEVESLKEFKVVQQFLDSPVGDASEAKLKKVFADKLIDATVARVITVADKVIERGVPVVLNRVCDLISKVYPPATVFVPVIKSAEKFIVTAAKVAVRKGMKYVAEGAKTVVRSVAKGLVKVGKKLASWLGL